MVQCQGADGCATGQICCGTMQLTTECQAKTTPCPMTAIGPAQICKTDMECVVAGNTCNPFMIPGGMTIHVCGAKDGGAGGEGGTTAEGGTTEGGTATDGGTGGDAGASDAAHD
jgi:hypothetical protein